MSVNWKGALGAAGGSIASLGDTMVKQHFLELRDQRMAEIANQKMDKQQAFQSSERVAGQGYLSQAADKQRAHQTSERTENQGYLSEQSNNRMAHTEKMEETRNTNAVARQNTSDSNADNRLDKQLGAAKDARRDGYANQELRDNKGFAQEYFFKNMDNKSKERLAKISTEAKKTGGLTPANLLAVDKWANDLALDVVIADGTTEKDAGFDTALADTANRIKNQMMSNYSSTGDFDGTGARMTAIADADNDAHWKAKWSNPEGESGVNNAEIDKSISFVEANLPPNAGDVDVLSFMQAHGASQEYAAKIVENMKPPKVGDVRTDKVFVGGQGQKPDNPNDQEQWQLTPEAQKQQDRDNWQGDAYTQSMRRDVFGMGSN